jgi:hypothetical protein
VIRVDQGSVEEWMQVDKAEPDGAGNEQLTVVRGYEPSSPQSFTTAATFWRETPPTSNPTKVILNPGTYVITGAPGTIGTGAPGGLYVCGSASLDASEGVLIYSTDDPGGNAAVGRIEFNTSGSVTLTPPTSGPYANITIFQDRNLTYVPTIPKITGPQYASPPSLTSGVDSSSATLQVTDPNEIEPGDVVQIDAERMLVLKRRSGGSVDVVRGYLGTTPAPHASTSPIIYVSFPGPNTCFYKRDRAETWDLALMAMKSTGDNGALGGISGTFYLAGPRAVFGDKVSGTADLSVFASCISVDTASATFNPGPDSVPPVYRTALVG